MEKFKPFGTYDALLQKDLDINHVDPVVSSSLLACAEGQVGKKNIRTFENLQKIAYPDGSESYLASMSFKNLNNIGDMDAVFVIDIVNGKYVGHTDVIYWHHPSYPGPFVANTHTDELLDPNDETSKLRQLGLGKRRYELSNHFCQEYIGLSLYCGYPNDDARPIWERLVDEGKAEKTPGVKERSSYEFRFKHLV